MGRTEVAIVPYREQNENIVKIRWRTDMEYLSTTETAEKWNISRRRVSKLCAEGRIEGAMLVGDRWVIPEDAQKPSDSRKDRYKVKDD